MRVGNENLNKKWEKCKYFIIIIMIFRANLNKRVGEKKEQDQVLNNVIDSKDEGKSTTII